MASTDALAQLHDIHMPQAITCWPLAFGWYLIAMALLAISIALSISIYRWYSKSRPKRQALRLLADYQKDYLQDANSQLCCVRISELLRRVALAYYPRTQVAHLHGQIWINFLNTTAPGIQFNAVRELILELPYQPRQRRDLTLLFKTTRAWIKRQGRTCSN